MKALFTYKGEIRITNCPQPLCGSDRVKVRVQYSSFSMGTESSRIKNQSISSKIRNRDFVGRAINRVKRLKSAKEFQTAVRKFSGFYEVLGYSGVGIVEEVGSRVTTGVKPGDKVVVGGEYANHAEYVSVPQGMCFKYEETNPVWLYASTFIMSIPMHSVNLLELKQGDNLVVMGGGIIGTLACLIAASRGINPYVVDPFPGAMAKKMYPEYDPNSSVEIDGILVASTELNGINDILPSAHKGVKVNILGEVDLGGMDKGLIEEMYGTVTFCNSFGYGRRIRACEYEGNYDNPSFPYTIQRNIRDSIAVISSPEGKKLFDKLARVADVNDFSPSREHINIVKY